MATTRSAGAPPGRSALPAAGVSIRPGSHRVPAAGPRRAILEVHGPVKYFNARRRGDRLRAEALGDHRSRSESAPGPPRREPPQHPVTGLVVGDDIKARQDEEVSVL